MSSNSLRKLDNDIDMSVMCDDGREFQVAGPA